MSRVRAPPRRGGAALQMDILDLSTAMDNAHVHDGRLKAALDDMQNRAMRPDLELAALKADTSRDQRLEDYLSFRKALVIPPDAAPATPAATSPTAAAPATAAAGAVSGSGGGEATAAADAPAPLDPIFTATAHTAVILPSPPADVEIPFLLDAARCDASSAGCPVLARVFASRAMKRLVYCDLSHNGLTDTGTMFGPFGDMCTALAALPALRFLSFAGNSLMAPGAESVARLLRTSSSLTHLDLSDCSLGAAGVEELLPAFNRALPADEGEDEDKPPADSAAGADAALLADLEDPDVAAIIAAAQAEREAEQAAGKKKKAAAAAAGKSGPSAASVGRVNDTLVWLDLSGNNLCTYGFDPKPAAKLVRTLLAHPALQHLNLGRNRLGDGKGVAEALARGVAKNTTLVSLVLDDNSVDAKPAAAMARGLEGNGTLTHLSLRGNRVRSDGASAFAALIRLTTMALPTDTAAAASPAPAPAAGAAAAGGGPSPAAAAAAASAPARRVPSLSWVDLRDNYIGTIGRSDLALALHGLPPPPEVTRGRAPGEAGAGGMEEEDMEPPASGEEGESVGFPGGGARDRSATDASSVAGLEPEGSIAVSSRPGTAGSGTEAAEVASGRTSRLADPASAMPTESSRVPTSASDVGALGGLEQPSVSDVEVEGGQRSPSKRVAGGGLRAVMALRTAEEEAAAGGGQGEAAPPAPEPPKTAVLPDGSTANRYGHRVLV